MTTSSRWKQEEEKGIEEEVEEGDEEFYESLDRIVSCSSSSCSSDNDEGGPYHHHRRRSGGGRLRKGDDSAAAAAAAAAASASASAALRFSMAALSMYDVWVAEPASVQERRQRLLRHLGLASDRTLARLNSSVAPYPVADDDGVEVEDAVVGLADACPGRRSASCNQLALDSPTKAEELATIPRSSSDGAVSSAATAVHRNHHQLCDVDDHHRTSGGSNGPSPASSKPPSGKFSRRSGEIGKSLFNTDSPFAGSSAELGHHQRLEDDSDSVLSGDHDPGVCTIKNLDNGEEFVVNELGEDGTWNKLQQVGTGRQLTGEEFQMCVVGHSPIVQELMRRQNVEEGGGKRDSTADSAVDGGSSRSGPKAKKRGGGWLRSIKNVASSVTGHHSWERRSSDEKDTSSEKGGRRSSSATDDSQDVSSHAPEKTKVRHYGKSCKDLTALYMSQEIQAHNGCIWSIKFSLDGRYLASAGEDRVIHVWQVIESERRGELAPDKLDEGATGSPEPALALSNGEAAHMEKKRRRKISYGRKSLNLDHVFVPENVFALSEKPLYSFRGHLADVLDLSWSKSEVSDLSTFLSLDGGECF